MVRKEIKFSQVRDQSERGAVEGGDKQIIFKV